MPEYQAGFCLFLRRNSPRKYADLSNCCHATTSELISLLRAIIDVAGVRCCGNNPLEQTRETRSTAAIIPYPGNVFMRMLDREFKPIAGARQTDILQAKMVARRFQAAARTKA